MFRWTTGLVYMRVFMAGAITTGARVAMIVVVKRSSAIPDATLAEEIGPSQVPPQKGPPLLQGIPWLDVPLIRFGEHVDADGICSQRTKGQRRNKLTRSPSHDYVYIEARFCEHACEERSLGRRYSPGDPQYACSGPPS